MNKHQQELIKLLACAIMGGVAMALFIQWFFVSYLPTIK